MEAFSSETGKTYPSWEALVKTEANGWVAAAVITSRTQSWPWIVGPFDTKAEAEKARVRMRNQFKREHADYPSHTYRCFVRPLWKTNR